MVWQIGEMVGDVKFVRADGSTIPLASFAGKPLLVIFFRHLL
jgi:hypothetical protein